jgi:hypothetical protein
VHSRTPHRKKNRNEQQAICVPGDPNSGIFTVQGKEFKGFQYGRPQSPPKHLNVELFPEGGHLDLFFDQKKNGPTVISQADINRVLQTIHKVPAEVAVRNTRAGLVPDA